MLNFFFFFFNDTATTEIYTLSLHDALPILGAGRSGVGAHVRVPDRAEARGGDPDRSSDRKSTRLNSSHGYISYAVFCLKKKKKKENTPDRHSTVKCLITRVCVCGSRTEQDW